MILRVAIQMICEIKSAESSVDELKDALDKWTDGFLSRFDPDHYINLFRSDNRVVRRGGVLWRFVPLRKSQVAALHKGKAVVIKEGQTTSWSRTEDGVKYFVKNAIRSGKASVQGVVFKHHINDSEVMVDIGATARKVSMTNKIGRFDPSMVDEVVVNGTGNRTIHPSDVVAFVAIEKAWGEDAEVLWNDEALAIK